ncbi:MAG: cytidylate kinase family protein [Candidatus Micrarchaeaceae archaeon]
MAGNSGFAASQHPLKICIGGYGSSGKTTLGHEIAKALHIKHVSESYKNGGAKDIEIIKKMQNLIKSHDKKFAKDFDNKILQESKGSCVVTTWLSAWIVKDATIRVWLNASLKERALRRSKINGLDIEKELRLLKQYDKLTHDHFKQVYGIDINNHDIFDLELNSEKLTVKEMVKIIVALAKARKQKSEYNVA